MDVLLVSGNAILREILSIKKANTDMYNSLSSLTGSLAVMIDFVNRRLREDNPIEDAMIRQLESTLASIDAEIKSFHEMSGKKLCGLFPYWRAWISLAPAIGMGARRILLRLQRLETDLATDLKLLDLQMQSTRTMSLYEMSGAAFLRQFESKSSKEFWVRHFEHAAAVPEDDFSSALDWEFRDLRDSNDHVLRLARFCAAALSRDGFVDVRDFSSSVGSLSLGGWASRDPKALTLIRPAHGGSVAFMENHGNHVVTGSEDGVAKVFSLRPDGALLLKTVLIGHSAAINDASCLDATVATASDDRSVKLWNMMDGTLLKTIRLSDAAKAVFFVSASRLVIASARPTHNIDIVDPGDNTVKARMYGHDSGTTSVSVCEGAVVTSGRDGFIRTWDAATGSEVSSVEGAAARCEASGDLVASYADSTLKLWRHRDRRLVLEQGVAIDGPLKLAKLVTFDGPRVYVLTTGSDGSDGSGGSDEFGVVVVVVARRRRAIESRAIVKNVSGAPPASVCVANGFMYVGFRNGDIAWYGMKGYDLAGSCKLGSGGSLGLDDFLQGLHQ
jgi:hypothetical protein